MNTSDLDIVYCLKNGITSEELRYSLRSLKNFPHRKVWFYGGKPNWAINIRHVPMLQNQTKWQNSTKMLEEACRNDELSSDIVWFNDDFFVMQPVDKLEYWHDRTLYDRVNDFATAYRVTSPYGLTLYNVAEALRARGKPVKNFALHVPIIFNRAKFLRMCRLYPNIIHGRSVYANEYEVPSIQHDDVKISDAHHGVSSDAVFLSTSDRSFAQGVVGEQIRARFSEPSPYEIPPPSKPGQSLYSATPFFNPVN